MSAIEFGSVSYFVYADVAEADSYLEPSTEAAAWRAETDETVKGRALVTATRIMDLQAWAGTKTDADQLQAWPRTGVTGYDDDETPLIMLEATAALANLIYNGTDVVNTASTAQLEKSIKAGSVAIEYFRGAEGKPTRLPFSIWEMIKSLLGGGVIISPSSSTGVSREAAMKDGFGLTLGR